MAKKMIRDCYAEYLACLGPKPWSPGHAALCTAKYTACLFHPLTENSEKILREVEKGINQAFKDGKTAPTPKKAKPKPKSPPAM